MPDQISYYQWKRGPIGGARTNLGDTQATPAKTDTSPDPAGNDYELNAVTTTGQIIGSNIITVIPNQPPGSLQWAKNYGGTAYNYGVSAAVDPTTGDVIVTGYFAGTTNFGGPPLTAIGNPYDMFLARYTSAGTHIWSLRYGAATGGMSPQKVVLDAAGNIYVAGAYNGIGDAGMGALSNAGDRDIFVAKYTSTGTPVWVKHFGSIRDDFVYDLVIRKFGGADYIYMTGTFSGICTYNPDTTVTGGISFTGNAVFHAEDVDVTYWCSVYGNANIYVVKLLASDGSYVWSKGWRTDGQSRGYGIAVDANGDVFLAGWLSGTIDFGNGTLAGSNTSFDLLVVKASGVDGTKLWANKYGTVSYDDQGLGIGLDQVNNPIVMGLYVGPQLDFGDHVFLNNAHTGQNMLFITKFSNGTGTAEWAFGSVSPGFTGSCYPKAMTTDAGGNTIVAGYFVGTMTFGTTTLTSTGTYDAFIIKVNSSGNVVWVKQFAPSNTSGFVQALGITTASSGAVVTTGLFQGTVNFLGTNLTFHSSYDVFVVKQWP